MSVTEAFSTRLASCLGPADLTRWASRQGILPVPLLDGDSDRFVVVDHQRASFVLDLRGGGGDPRSIAWSSDVPWHISVDGFRATIRHWRDDESAEFRAALLWEPTLFGALMGDPASLQPTIAGAVCAADAALRPFVAGGDARYRMTLAMLLGPAGRTEAVTTLRKALLDALRLPDEVYRNVAGDLGAARSAVLAMDSTDVARLVLEALARPAAAAEAYPA